MIRKSLLFLTLAAGVLVLFSSGLLLLDWYLLPTQNGIAYLSNISIREFGQGDEIPDSLTMFSFIGILIGVCGVSLLAMLPGSVSARSGVIALVILAVGYWFLCPVNPIATMHLVPFLAGLVFLCVTIFRSSIERGITIESTRFRAPKVEG